MVTVSTEGREREREGGGQCVLDTQHSCTKPV